MSCVLCTSMGRFPLLETAPSYYGDEASRKGAVILDNEGFTSLTIAERLLAGRVGENDGPYALHFGDFALRGQRNTLFWFS